MDYVSLLSPLIKRGLIEVEIIYTNYAENGQEIWTGLCHFNRENFTSGNLNSKKTVKDVIYKKIYTVIILSNLSQVSGILGIFILKEKVDLSQTI